MKELIAFNARGSEEEAIKKKGGVVKSGRDNG